MPLGTPPTHLFNQQTFPLFYVHVFTIIQQHRVPDCSGLQEGLEARGVNVKWN